MLSGPGKTGMFAICSAAAMLLGSTALARADGLPGGNCCVDLEERVAELEATTVRKGNRRVSLTVSGQVATGIMIWDDGDDSDVYVTDNTFSSGGTGVTFDGSARISPNLTAGFEIALGITAGARSSNVSAENDDGRADGDSDFVMTRGNWYLDHKQLGRLTVGRINTATAGATAVNLGGTNVVANVSIGYWQRSFNIVGMDSTWTDLLGGNSVNGSALSRANAVRYTSPTFGGFQVSAAAGEDDIWDVALRYAGESAGFRFAAAIGYVENQAGVNEFVSDFSGDEPDQVKGSASIMHIASGLYLTGAFVDQDGGDAESLTGETVHDATLYYVQGGIAKNWTGLGNTAFYGEYANVDSSRTAFFQTGGTPQDPDGFNFDYTGDADVWGLGVVQHIDAAAMEMFLSYRNYSGSTVVDDTFDVDAEDMDVIMSGARIRF